VRLRQREAPDLEPGRSEGKEGLSGYVCAIDKTLAATEMPSPMSSRSTPHALGRVLVMDRRSGGRSPTVTCPLLRPLLRIGDVAAPALRVRGDPRDLPGVGDGAMSELAHLTAGNSGLERAFVFQLKALRLPKWRHSVLLSPPAPLAPRLRLAGTARRGVEVDLPATPTIARLVRDVSRALDDAGLGDNVWVEFRHQMQGTLATSTHSSSTGGLQVLQALSHHWPCLDGYDAWGMTHQELSLRTGVRVRGRARRRLTEASRSRQQ
jgi:hypothetical protein